MSDEAPSKGWILHSAGRKFGPLTEDEMRGYFRAHMVKSVDRITAPGDFAMHAAVDVAAMLGEPVPPGPPPPAIDADIAPKPAPEASIPELSMDSAASQAETAANRQKELDARAMEAIARMQMELATSRAPAEKRRSGWIGPIVIVVALIALMMVALSMLKKMRPASAGPSEGPTGYVEPVGPPQAEPVPAASPGGGARPAVPAGAGQAPIASSDAEQFQASLQRADMLRSTRQWPALAEFAKGWSVQQPGRTEPWQFLGVAYAAQENYAGAADAFNHVLQRDPENAVVRESLADVYLGGHRYAEAAQLYAKLVTTNSGNARMWNNYGMSLRGISQDAQAVAALETAVRLDPNMKQAWTNLGQTYAAMGDQAKAAAAFANAK
jgi:cytochrome c-type biogenesis protein CcmH/NrfG